MQDNALNKILEPAPVSFWPPQPGWYVVLAIVILIIGYGIYKFVQHKKKNAYRSLAVKALDNITNIQPLSSRINATNNILKACALNAFKRETIAKLYGKEWVDFLNSTSSAATFKANQEQLLQSVIYENPSNSELTEDETNEFLNLCKQWIKTHKSV